MFNLGHVQKVVSKFGKTFRFKHEYLAIYEQKVEHIS